MSTSQETQILKDSRLYVRDWFNRNEIEINERGELKDKLNRLSTDIFDTLWLDYISEIREHNQSEMMKAPNLRDKVTGAKEQDMSKALSELISNEKAIHRSKRIETLKCEEEDLSELKKFVKAIYGEVNDTHTGVLAHWLWSVKNKMLDREVTHHIMPIMFGKQGGGKTVALNKLIKPIQNYRLNIKMNQMTDDRYFFSMAENYVVVFDEMQGASRTDIDCLKNQITNDWNDARKLGTNSVLKVRQSCSFIGATNKPVSAQVVDPTGMRRFWEIRTLDKMDWELMGSIDFEKLWKGIDEEHEDGYITNHLEEVRREQDELTIEDEYECFMEDHSLKPVKEDNENSTLVSIDLVYQAYKSWAFENGHKIHNKVWFSRVLKSKGIVVKRKKEGNVKSRYYIVHEDCEIED